MQLPLFWIIIIVKTTQASEISTTCWVTTNLSTIETAETTSQEITTQIDTVLAKAAIATSENGFEPYNKILKTILKGIRSESTKAKKIISQSKRWELKPGKMSNLLMPKKPTNDQCTVFIPNAYEKIKTVKTMVDYAVVLATAYQASVTGGSADDSEFYTAAISICTHAQQMVNQCIGHLRQIKLYSKAHKKPNYNNHTHLCLCLMPQQP